MNVLFLGCIYSQIQSDLFQKKSTRGYQYAAQNFQQSLIRGFLECPQVNLNVLTIPSLSTFPIGNKLSLIRDSLFVYDGKVLGKSFGFINLPILNHLHQSRIDRYIDQWCKDSTESKCIIV